ncbi:MAG TPA: hypothetical protein DD827_02930 [Gammaproteobacteria bacterium]|nr:hypothetical protein [Gammaproteobacteria bacterium]
MNCTIYRCSKKNELYLYLAEKDAFSDLPDGLMAHLGEVEFVMDLVLSPERKLAQENVTTVISNLKERGFHLQMPAGETEKLAWWDNEKLKQPSSSSPMH